MLDAGPGAEATPRRADTRNGRRAPAPRPTRRQIQVSTEIVRWYLRHYYQTPDDPGVAAMFCDPGRVGAFAVDPEALRAGDGAALFRLLVTTTMFQRRQDLQIQRVLQGINEDDARELTDADRLLQLVDQSPCARMRSTVALREECDLKKDPLTRLGACDSNQSTPCHLKRHTVLLKRYGHFGKVPTSAALMLRETGAPDLAGLYGAVLDRLADPGERALALQGELSRAWRVSEKISAMFLSAVTNPDLSEGLAPWTEGLDWTQYVVIDSNVDLFLRATGYRGFWTYEARRTFLRDLARRIDLTEMSPALQPYNPRLVQQAAYLFMSATNRRAATRDCMRIGVDACARCPSALSERCPVRS